MTAPRATGTSRRSNPSSRQAAPQGVSFTAVELAVERAVASWRKQATHPVDSAYDVAEAITRAITKFADGSIDTRLRSPDGRRLLDLVRLEIVCVFQEEDPAPPAEDMLRTLAAIESVRTAIEADHAEDFVDQLSGPDGLELLVEVAHDLRSPLTSILFLAETLQRRLSGDLNELQHRQLGLIYSAGLGLSEMASNVLELIRGGNRLAEDEPSPFSITEILDSVSDITRPMAEEKGLSIRLNTPAKDHRYGHPLALSRVLLNLTTNALKFTDNGFVEIVARENGSKQIEFSVRDTGRGINSDALETLYTPFRRAAHRDGYVFSGTGLGLALCRRLVGAMGSELELESKTDWGTRFYFTLDLPLVRSEP